MAAIIMPRMPLARTIAARTYCALETSTFTRSFTIPTRFSSTSSITSHHQPQRCGTIQSGTTSRLRLTSRRAFASAAPPPSSPISSQPKPSNTAGEKLNWNEFFTIRRRRRFVGLCMSIVGGVAAALVGPPLIGQYNIDAQLEAITGIGSLYMLAGASVLVVVSGWFAGRIVGESFFTLIASSRGWRQVFIEKEKSLFHRIKRYRADPTSSSPQNPIPDYYGEKIGSVAGYRQWLKDQRAFTKKMYRGTQPSA